MAERIEMGKKATQWQRNEGQVRKATGTEPDIDFAVIEVLKSNERFDDGERGVRKRLSHRGQAFLMYMKKCMDIRRQSFRMGGRYMVVSAAWVKRNMNIKVEEVPQPVTGVDETQLIREAPRTTGVVKYSQRMRCENSTAKVLSSSECQWMPG